MWARAGRDLLREPPQGHRRKLSATLRGSVRRARSEETRRSDDDPVWQPKKFGPRVRGFHPSTLEETSFSKKKYRSRHRCAIFP